MYLIKYTEQSFNSKPPERFELPNLTKEQANKVIEILNVPIQGKVIKWFLYEDNRLIEKGESR